MSWLSIGSEDLSNRPEVKAGDKVREIGAKGRKATRIVEERGILQFGCVEDVPANIVGVRGRLLSGWEHVR
jgi:hypothetical protein